MLHFKADNGQKCLDSAHAQSPTFSVKPPEFSKAKFLWINVNATRNTHAAMHE
jgi:hypothetical protein